MFGIGVVEIVVLAIAAAAVTAYCGGGLLQIVGAGAATFAVLWMLLKFLQRQK